LITILVFVCLSLLKSGFKISFCLEATNKAAFTWEKGYVRTAERKKHCWQ